MCSEPRKNMAQEAVAHIIRRVRIDANFSWLMLGTESLAMRVKAHAERLGQPEADVAAEVQQRAASNHNTPEVVALRSKVESLERKLARLSGDKTYSEEIVAQRDESIRSICRVEELVRTAEIMRETVTVDRLRDAIEGPTRPLGASS